MDYMTLLEQIRDLLREIREEIRIPQDDGTDIEYVMYPQENSTVVRMLSWHPIETAPRDGSRVMGYGEKCHYEVIRYSLFDSCWVLVSEDEPVVYPSHWMPLLDPPEGSE